MDRDEKHHFRLQNIEAGAGKHRLRMLGERREAEIDYVNFNSDLKSINFRKCFDAKLWQKEILKLVIETFSER